jgi:O-antigen ligase
MRRHPRLVKNLVPAAILLYLIVTFVFQIDIRAELAGAVGRDPTLTGRTDIWTTVLSMHTNPIVGTGYESFWLGPRLLEVWRLAGPINEAHNGYLETYLNLGIIGVALLIIFLISTYKSICKQLDASSDMGSMLLALWIILIVYNFTESAFKGQLMWLIFLLGVIVVPAKARKSRVRSSDLNEARSEAMRLSVG